MKAYRAKGWNFLVSLMLLVSSSVYAIPVPDLLLPVGQAKLKVLWFDIYEANLYSVDGHFSGIKGPLYLKLVYLRDISKDDLLNETDKQMKKVAEQTHKQSKGGQGNEKDQLKKQTVSWLHRLNDIWPDIKKGESLSFYLSPSGKGHFYHNGIYIGEMTDTNFGPSFLGIWLGENSSFPKMTKQLIGGI